MPLKTPECKFNKVITPFKKPNEIEVVFRICKNAEGYDFLYQIKKKKIIIMQSAFKESALSII